MWTPEEWWQQVSYALLEGATWNQAIDLVIAEFGPSPGPPPQWFQAQHFPRAPHA